MRLLGRLTEWNDERGFGFVTRNGTGERHFLHVSQIDSRRSRPQVGGMLTYELGKDSRGRVQARNARWVGDARPERSRSVASSLGGTVVALLVLAAVAYVGYVRFSSPNSTVPAAVDKIVFERDALQSRPEFKCSPEKNSCSKMTSCAEAIFHQEKCGVPNMDGDHDGIPCERQWCN